MVEGDKNNCRESTHLDIISFLCGTRICQESTNEQLMAKAIQTLTELPSVSSNHRLSLASARRECVLTLQTVKGISQ